MNKKEYHFLTFLLFLHTSLLFSQNKHDENITVFSDLSTEKEITITEEIKELKKKVTIIYKSYEKFKFDYCSFLREEGWEGIVRKKELLTSNIRSNAFYSDSKSTTWSIPKSKLAKYSYKINNPNLLESGLLRFDKSNIDIYTYSIRFPNFLQIKIDSSYLTNPKKLTIDSKDSADYKIFNFKYLKDRKKIKISRYSQRTIVKQEAIRYIITPVEYKYKELEYFSKSYLKLIEKSLFLDEPTKRLVEEICQNVSHVDTASKKLMHYIFEHFNYLSVQDGVYSYIPKSPNDLAEKKYGDCKGFSAFIYAALKHLGFSPKLAISATLSYGFDMDFPSMVSGNHMICIVKSGKDIHFIDATDNQSIYPLPSHHIQGKHILILDSIPCIHYIEPVADTLNTIKIRTLLKQEQSKLIGTTKITIDNYAAYSILHKEKGESKTRVEKYIKRYIKSYLGEVYLDSIQFKLGDKRLFISAKINIDLESILNVYAFKNTVNSIYNNYFQTYPESQSIYFPHTINLNKTTKLLFENTVQLENEYKKLVFDKSEYFYSSFSDSLTNSITFKQNIKIKDIILDPKEIKNFNSILNEINSISQKIYLLNSASIHQ